MQVLDSVHYRSQVTMGTDELSKRKDIHTILSLGLTTAGANVEVSAAASSDQPARCMRPSQTQAMLSQRLPWARCVCPALLCDCNSVAHSCRCFPCFCCRANHLRRSAWSCRQTVCKVSTTRWRKFRGSSMRSAINRHEHSCRSHSPSACHLFSSSPAPSRLIARLLFISHAAAVIVPVCFPPRRVLQQHTHK